MDWNVLVSALDREELLKLLRAAWRREDELTLSEVRAGNYSLTAEEKEMLKQGRNIDTVKSVRNRTGLTLRVSKQLVDVLKAK